jgi:photosystem II stability/assembly factor-like uncharacterized protein
VDTEANPIESTMQESLLASLEWRLLGPHRGGRVVAVAGDVSDPAVYYFGACAGGVWKTSDAGLTWRNVSDGYFTTAAVGALATSLSDPNVLYAGTGETCIRNNVSHGDGVYKSTDAGATWTHVGLRNTRHIGEIRIHPQNPDLVYVAALGHAFGPSTERGVFRSSDGGQSWERMLFVSERAGSHDLAMDLGNPRILYAAVWQAQRFPHTLISGGPESGLWKTADGGDSWTELTERPGLPKRPLGKIGVAVSPAQRGRVWALIEAEEGGLFRSDDGGETWECVSDAPFLRTRAFYYMHLYADPKDPETVWVLNYKVWKSTDGGKTFTSIPSPHGDEHDLWINPENPELMIKGDDGGASITVNGGRSWTSQYNQPTAQLYHVTTDNQFPYRVYGAQQDNSALSLPSRTVDGAIHERHWYAPGGGESGYIAVKPDDPNIVVASGPAGRRAFNDIMTFYDHRTGQKRNITVWPELYGWGVGAESLKYRFQWTFPIMYSPHDPNVLYVAGNRVFRSVVGGASFEPISEDLTRNDPGKLGPSGGITRDNTGAEVYCTVFALAESPKRVGLLWAGSDDGLIYISRDGGEHWTNVTPPQLPEWALISILDPSPHEEGAAYVTATRYKLDDTRPYLYKTTDYGNTWSLITTGIPEHDFTRVIREDPNRRGLLYAGTETGIYVSFDDGARWQRLGGNLPVVPIYDLVIKGSEMVVATHGRSFWILDDLTPFHQMSDEIARKSIHLFEPAPTVRLRVDGGMGWNAREHYVNYAHVGTSVFAYDHIHTPEGATRNQPLTAGANRPVGVLIQYFLRDASQKAELRISDAQGEEVRSFTEGVPRIAGMNRFLWNLRLPSALRVEGEKLDPWHRDDGPLALPGQYRVVLEVDGATLTQPFEIRRDPRVQTSDEDLRAQFEMLLQIRDRLSETNDLVNQIESARRHLSLWMEAKGDEGRAVRAAAEELEADLGALEKELIDVNMRQAQLYPSGLHEKLNALFDAVDSADYAPTQQAREVFARLTDQLGDVSSRVAALMHEGGSRLNAAINSAGYSPAGWPSPVPAMPSSHVSRADAAGVANGGSSR